MAIRTPVLLVVEDELALLESIVFKANALGIEPVSTRTAEEAKRMFSEIPIIDGVWVDHFLPGGNGVELVEYIRVKLGRTDTKIFLVTNAVEPDIINEYIKHNIQGYFPKMLSDLDSILTKIRSKL